MKDLQVLALLFFVVLVKLGICQESALGVKYSASTDVSHISFNSPLATWGNELKEIQLPAAPIQPANLRQKDENLDENVLQQIQSPAPNQPQFISVQQFPANPQLQAQLPQAQQLLETAQQQPAQVQPIQQYQPQPFQVRQQQYQQYILPQQQQSATIQQPINNNNGYFATGPFANQYAQPAQYLQQSIGNQFVPPQQFVSRVSFNRPNAQFSYSF